MGQHIRTGLRRPVDLPSLLSSMMDGGRDPLFLRIGFDLIHSRHGRKKTKDEQSGFAFSTWLSHGRAWSLCCRRGRRTCTMAGLALRAVPAQPVPAQPCSASSPPPQHHKEPSLSPLQPPGLFSLHGFSRSSHQLSATRLAARPPHSSLSSNTVCPKLHPSLSLVPSKC